MVKSKEVIKLAKEKFKEMTENFGYSKAVLIMPKKDRDKAYERFLSDVRNTPSGDFVVADMKKIMEKGELPIEELKGVLDEKQLDSIMVVLSRNMSSPTNVLCTMNMIESVIVPLVRRVKTLTLLVGENEKN